MRHGASVGGGGAEMRPRAGGASDACMRTDPMWRVAVGGSARALYTQAMCRVDGLCCARVCDLGGRGGRGTLKRAQGFNTQV
jgi:hypothetical protein